MANTKNYGLKGIGDDVQFGKGGGRFVYNTGANDFRATLDGSTLVHVQVLDPVSDTDAATKLYVDDRAAGLDTKENVKCATTANIGTYSSSGGPSGNGQLTSVPATIDGVTLAEGDRVLVKDQTDQKQNGIYVVSATTTTLNRATDHDSDSEVTAGNFVFVAAGTLNTDTGWVLRGPDPLTINTSNLSWSLFSTSGNTIAGNGLIKNGNTLDLDFSELPTLGVDVITGTDEIIIQDGSTESRITVTNFLDTFNIPVYTGTLLNNSVLFTNGSGDIISSTNFTFNDTTLSITAGTDITGDLDVDNVNIDGNTISVTDTNGDLVLQPNGTGQISLVNGSGEEVLEIQDTVDAVNGLAIVAGATGNAAVITTGTGSEANIDIGFLTNGTGVLSVVAGSGNYEDNVTADDDIPNKAYVDAAIQSLGGSGALDSVVGTVDLTSATAQNIGAATGIPANATILSVTLDITAISDAATTVTVGDSVNGAASYMTASENDPEIQGIYVADGRLANGGTARQALATVATAGTTGAATCVITFRHP